MTNLDELKKSNDEYFLKMANVSPDTHFIKRCACGRGWIEEIKNPTARTMCGVDHCIDNEKSPRVSKKKKAIPKNLMWDVFERDNFTCQLCGSRRFLTIDHIIPESKGGETTMENCQTLCNSCNSKKGTK